jgi:cysteine-rich repeat protein
MRQWMGIPAACLLLGAGCKSATEADPPDEESSSTTGSADVTGVDVSTGADPATSSTTTSAGVTTTPVPECGNAVVEAPEQCDDGNLEPGDGCEADCTTSIETKLWEQIVSGAAGVQESGHGVVTDAEGNVYATGYVIDTVGNPDIWVGKFDPDGTAVWSVELDPSEGLDDRGYGIALDGENDIIVTGESTVDIGDIDIWVAKLDPEGIELWSETVAGPAPGVDGGYAVAVDSTDAIVVAGHVRAANNDNDIWIGKFDPEGEALWAAVIAGPEALDDRAHGVDIDGDDHIIVTGFISHSGFNRDVWLAKFDPEGETVWTTLLDSPTMGSESAFAVVVAPDGSIGVAGTTPVTADNDDVWLGRYDQAGTLVWVKSFSGPAIRDDHGLGIAADSSGAFFVVGFKGVADNDTDIWLRKWDAGGNVVWTQNVAGSGMRQDQALGVAVDGNDDVVVTGEIRGAPDTNGDIWVAKFGGS